MYNKEYVLKKFKEVHGDKYDYSLVDYKNVSTPVTIICPKHGKFQKRPENHIKGAGCHRCIKLLTQDQVINDFKKVHGDKYDYSLVKYNHSQKKVTIICPEHGEFQQTPNSHKNGASCKKCYVDSQREDISSIISKFRKIHGDKYDYSKVNYTSVRHKVTIRCPKHGDFQQAVQAHLRGFGCYKCGNLKKGPKKGNSKFTHNDVVEIFKKVHGDKYDYSKLNYKGSEQKVTITCPKHGEFQQSFHNHRNGRGCPKCGRGKTKKTLKK